MTTAARHIARSATAALTLTLVLALLSFIAELKPDSVIFAMEEPEVAVQPHTQRRIADYLLLHTKQAFVTSHSPYVIERFTPENTFLLTRSAGGNLESMCVADATGLKELRCAAISREVENKRGLT